MIHPQQDEELRQKIDAIFFEEYNALHDNFWHSEFEASKEASVKVMSLIAQQVREARIEELERADDYNFNIQEPCEPDCDPVRHARHEGNWKQYWGMREYFEDRLDDLQAKANQDK